MTPALIIFLGPSLILAAWRLWQFARRCVMKAYPEAAFRGYLEAHWKRAGHPGASPAFQKIVLLECTFRCSAFCLDGKRTNPDFIDQLNVWMAQAGWVPGGPEGFTFDPVAAEAQLGHEVRPEPDAEKLWNRLIPQPLNLDELASRAPITDPKASPVHASAAS